jgi:prophage regulatory protein
MVRHAIRGAKMKLLSYDDLKPAKGICYSKTQLWRLEKTGEFPRRVQLTSNPNGKHGWLESEIDAWIEGRVRQRDEEAA